MKHNKASQHNLFIYLPFFFPSQTFTIFFELLCVSARACEIHPESIVSSDTFIWRSTWDCVRPTDAPDTTIKHDFQRVTSFNMAHKEIVVCKNPFLVKQGDLVGGEVVFALRLSQSSGAIHHCAFPGKTNYALYRHINVANQYLCPASNATHFTPFLIILLSCHLCQFNGVYHSHLFFSPLFIIIVIIFYVHLLKWVTSSFIFWTNWFCCLNQLYAACS